VDIIVAWNLSVGVIWVGGYQFFHLHILNWSYHAYPLTITSYVALIAMIFGSSYRAPLRDHRVGWWPLPLPAISGLIFSISTIAILWFPREHYSQVFEFARNVPASIFATIGCAIVVGLSAAVIVLSRRTAIKLSAVPFLAIGLMLPAIADSTISNYALRGCQAPRYSNAVILGVFSRFSSTTYPANIVVGPPTDSLKQIGDCSLSLADVAHSLGQIYPFALSGTTFSTPDFSRDSPQQHLIIFFNGTSLAGEVQRRIASGELVVEQRMVITIPEIRGLIEAYLVRSAGDVHG
jgi:hypothetical protein